jgi:hypothetical protein
MDPEHIAAPSRFGFRSRSRFRFTLSPAALLWARIAASVVIVSSVAWVLYAYFVFQVALDEVDVMVIGGRDPRPMAAQILEEWDAWLTGICSVGGLAAFISIWKFTHRGLPILLMTLAVLVPSFLVGGIMWIAAIDAWRWNNDLIMNSNYYKPSR